MKRIFVKKLLLFLLTIVTVLSSFSLTACGGGSSKADVQTFYDLVVESQECLDEVADDIYQYWYDAIYNDKYGSDIDTAIYYALTVNSINLDKIEENEPLIQEAYKKVKDSDLSHEIKAVMLAYADYYEFVVNVSGSFNSFKADKETLKKELASALKSLYLEM